MAGENHEAEAYMSLMLGRTRLLQRLFKWARVHGILWLEKV